MGMKRRGMGRRQVLNLSDTQDSPRRTWQTKYQQICSDTSRNGTYSSKIASKTTVKNNPLSGLLGHYQSDSDNEDEKADEDKLSSQVSDFMKEIQTLAPVEAVKKVPTAATTTIANTTTTTIITTTSATTSHVTNQVTNHLSHGADPSLSHPENYAANYALNYAANYGSSYVTGHVLSHPASYVTANMSGDVTSHMQVQSTSGAVALENKTTPWRECVDESSGFTYYWNTETNSVTWDIPPEFQNYPGSMRTAQESLWAHEQQMSMAYHTHMMAQLHPHHLHQHVPSVSGVVDSSYIEQPQIQPESQVSSQGSAEKKGPEKKRKKKEFDSDDERIEMITSYGPTSDDESDEDEESKPPEKKRKSVIGNIIEDENDKHLVPSASESDLKIGPEPKPTIGPMFVDGNDDNVEDAEFGGSSLLSSHVQDLGAPGDEDSRGQDSPAEPLIKVKTPASKILVADSTEIKNEVYPVPDSSEEITKVDSSFCPKSSTSDVSSTLKSNRIVQLKSEEQDLSEIVSGTSTPVIPATEGESDVDSADTEEKVILNRLRNQARILKELGGEVPDEVQHLIEPNPLSTLEVDDVIAQIEKELPPDYKTDKIKIKQTISDSRRKCIASSGIKSNTNISSFALIAGYGDDSDTEDDKKCNKSVNSVVVVVEEEDEKVEKKCLFPIQDHKIKQDILCIPAIKEAANSVSTESSKEESDASCNASNSRTSRFSEMIEHSTSFIGPLETNIPDSTTNSKSFKRKKRLDVEVLPTIISKPTPVVSQPADSGSEKKLTAVAVSAIVSSSASFPNWSYNSDPSSGERRGFGFQSHNEEETNIFMVEDKNPTELHTSGENSKKSLSRKKGMINFIKAETLNPEIQVEPELVSVKEDKERSPAKEEIKAERKEEVIEETEPLIEEMTELIKEKVRFLGEGKEPVPPVQIMAIQFETLLSAWQSGALAHSYWSRWLADTSTELARLEQAAVPCGWACEWDRYSITFSSTLRSSTCASSICWIDCTKIKKINLDTFCCKELYKFLKTNSSFC